MVRGEKKKKKKKKKKIKRKSKNGMARQKIKGEQPCANLSDDAQPSNYISKQREVAGRQQVSEFP
ncbi:hypothetical protein [Plesiomonas shigelloides]|uniref:hypothetical protein n=1 Tax=Plesiomonas shigelloides TaxID=703 RepID=UPI001C5AE9D2|nr:hypothetical protein [Plesiomonas shigelloides]MBW3792172.1 hypothetical protein [Plesiomonas shigelloides]